MRKYFSLIDKVYSPASLLAAYQKLRYNQGSKTPGIDGVAITAYAESLPDRLAKLSEALRKGTYRPSAVKRIYIDKPDGSTRSLGISTIEDRIVSQSLVNVLTPIFDPTFHPSSYGYRPGRSAHHALAKAERFARHYQLDHVMDLDIHHCFDSLDHDLLISLVNERVSDGKVLALIKLLISSEVYDQGVCLPTTQGVPQGNILSPLLSNIYLNKFDQYMKGKGIRIVRYADDILVFAPSRSLAGKYGAIATNYLEQELLLKVNASKSELRSLKSGIPYLGCIIQNIGIRVSPVRVAKFKDKVRQLTVRNSGQKLSDILDSLNDLLRGFANYYRVALSQGLYKFLMKWIRRRLRMLIMKQWKSWKALHKQLRRMGHKGSFEKISVNRWRNSNCTLIHMALPNKWLDELGLYQMDKVQTNTLHQYYDTVLNKV